MILFLQRYFPRLLAWWDWKVFHWSYASMKRLAPHSLGFILIHHRLVAELLNAHPANPRLERAANTFCDALACEQKKGMRG